MLAHDAILALGLLPFRVRLEQLFVTSPVAVLWEFPVLHETGDLLLMVTSRMDWVRWS